MFLPDPKSTGTGIRSQPPVRLRSRRSVRSSVRVGRSIEPRHIRDRYPSVAYGSPQGSYAGSPSCQVWRLPGQEPGRITPTATTFVIHVPSFPSNSPPSSGPEIVNDLSSWVTGRSGPIWPMATGRERAGVCRGRGFRGYWSGGVGRAARAESGCVVPRRPSVRRVAAGRGIPGTTGSGAQSIGRPVRRTVQAVW